MTILTKVRQELVDMLKNEIAPAEVAHELGISVSTVYKVRHEENLVPVQDLFGSIDVEKVLHFYTSTDMGVQQICRSFHLTPNRFYQLLVMHNVPTRRGARSEEARQKQMDVAVDLYVTGAPLWKIKEETGVSLPYMYDELRKKGIPLRRPRGEWGRGRAQDAQGDASSE